MRQLLDLNNPTLQNAIFAVRHAPFPPISHLIFHSFISNLSEVHWAAPTLIHPCGLSSHSEKHLQYPTYSITCIFSYYTKIASGVRNMLHSLFLDSESYAL